MLQWVGVTNSNVDDLKTINSIVLPIQYSSTHPMYKHIVSSGPQFSYLVYHPLEGVIAGMGCRLEPAKEPLYVDKIYHRQTARIYIITLAVLSMYRQQKIGTQLLQRLIETCNIINANNSVEYIIQDIYLHVQCSNHPAISFYQKLGFQIEKNIPQYYKKFSTAEEQNAHILVLPMKLTSE